MLCRIDGRISIRQKEYYTFIVFPPLSSTKDPKKAILWSNNTTTNETLSIIYSLKNYQAYEANLRTNSNAHDG